MPGLINVRALLRQLMKDVFQFITDLFRDFVIPKYTKFIVSSSQSGAYVAFLDRQIVESTSEFFAMSEAGHHGAYRLN